MAAKETITVYDQQGQPREIPRAEFLEKVLPKLVEAAWNNADQLYQQVVFALENGLHDGVLKAAERLDELDQGGERGKVLLSATQFQAGRHEEAEATLRASLERNGESAVAVVNLARMRQARGDEEGAQDLLSRALELDPNQENALGWSCQLMQQAGGEEAVVGFLEDLSQGAGNWRATLWLAQQRLRGKDADAGVALLRGVIGQVARDPGALMSVSADLGKAGKLAEMIDLVAPVYDERRHRPETGFNLMQAYAQLQRLPEARALHARLVSLNLPPLANALAQFGARIGIAPPAGTPAAPGQPGQPAQGQQQLELRLFIVQGPLWMQGLGAPWLAPEKDAKAPLVTFAGFADESLASQPKGQQPRVDDDIARMARALPLYLSESVYLRTIARSDMVVPLLPGGMFVVMGQLWPAEALQKGRPEEAKPTYIVQGLLARDDGGYRVELVIFDGKDSKELHRIRAIGLRKLEEHALRLEDELLDWLESRGIARTVPKAGLMGKLFGGKPGAKGPETVSRPAPDQQAHHLLATSNLLTMAIPAIGLGSREILANEAELLAGCLEAARQDPKCGASKALAACSVMFAVRFGSTALDKAKGELLAMVEQDRDPQGVLHMLSPGLYMRLGERDKAERARATLKGTAGAGYDQWLDNLKP